MATPVPPGPPDPPTAALGPPAGVVGPPGRVATPAMDPALLFPLEDAIRSLRGALAVVGLVAVAALGLSIYLLVRDSDGRRSRGTQVSQAEVSSLNDRVNRLADKVNSVRAASTGAAASASASLGSRVDALGRTVKQLAARPQPADPTQALAKLSSRLDRLAGQVTALQSSQSQTQTETTTTVTTTTH